MRQGLGHVKAGQARAAAVAVLLTIAGCDARPERLQVEVTDAVVQLPAVPGRPASAYFRLTAADPATRLVSVTSPAFERIELHASMTMHGMASMAPLAPDQLILAGGRLDFAPGGKHAMLFGARDAGALAPGKQVPLVFTFAPARTITVAAQVRALDVGER